MVSAPTSVDASSPTQNSNKSPRINSLSASGARSNRNFDSATITFGRSGVRCKSDIKYVFIFLLRA